MSEPTENYRKGYEKGRRDSAGGLLAEVTMGMLRDDPGGYFAAGYNDGAGGKRFNPPSASATKPAPTRSAGSKLTDLESQWYHLCDHSEFIAQYVADYYTSALGAQGSHVAIVIGLHNFTGHTCPKCGEQGQFKIHFLGSLNHSECGWIGYMGTGSYIGFQLTQILHSGIRAGGTAKEEVDKKTGGNWVAGLLVFMFVAIFRAMLAMFLIPPHALVALFQKNQSKTDVVARVVTLGATVAVIVFGIRALDQASIGQFPTASYVPPQKARVFQPAQPVAPPQVQTPTPASQTADTQQPLAVPESVPNPSPASIPQTSTATQPNLGHDSAEGEKVQPTRESTNLPESSSATPSTPKPDTIQHEFEWRTYSRASFSISYPSNWAVSSLDKASAVIIAPPGGTAQDDVIYGARIGSFWVRGSQPGWANLEDATGTLIHQIQLANPGKQWNRSWDHSTVGNLPGLSSMLPGPTKSAGEGQMWVLTTQFSDHAPLWYVLFTAPNEEYRRYEASFRRMLQSFHVSSESF